jgi:hypothetical protein
MYFTGVFVPLYRKVRNRDRYVSTRFEAQRRGLQATFDTWRENIVNILQRKV